MATASALGMVRMNCATCDRRNRCLEEPGLIDRIGVDRRLDVIIVCDRKARIDRCRRRSPVLVQLEAAGAGSELLGEWSMRRRIPFSEEPEVDRPCIGGR